MNENPSLHGSEVAIVGLTGRFPGASNLDVFWQNLRDGVESIRFSSDDELEKLGVDSTLLHDPNYVKASAVLDGMQRFDAGFFGYTPREAELMDPQQRIFLECAWEALENAGYDAATCRETVGVFAGASTNTYMIFNLLPNQHKLGPVDSLQADVSSAVDFLATRVSYKLNLKGPGYTVQTACSTSLLAVHLACQSLLNEECDLALAGGVSINVKHPEGYAYMEGGIVSPDGHCRAFDAQANGTIFGSGVGVVVLKRLEDALAQGDNIRAVIRGSAINNDGSDKVGYTAPSVNGQSSVITEALAVSQVEAESISYIETHGTATQMGDPIEIRALTKAFRAETERKNFCAIGSVKSNIGHLAGAAGVASLIKAVLSLENGQIPPSLHFDQPNPQIDFANSPFYVNNKLSDWKRNGTPRRAGVSSFGVGGTNVHLVLEEAPTQKTTAPSRPNQLILLSAKNETALEKATSNLAAALTPETNLADVAYTLQTGRSAFSHRRMIVADTSSAAVTLLESRKGLSAVPQVQERPVAFLFSGQGAQYVNMGRGLYQTEAVFRKWVDACAESLIPHLKQDLRHLLYPQPDTVTSADLNQTMFTQPALFTIEYALAQLWMSWGVRPRAMLGHSIGEYVAACLAGVFSLEDALTLVAARGRLMQSLPAGAMLTVFLPEAEVLPLLNPALSLAAVNGPDLCVVSGSFAAVDALKQHLDQENIHYRPLVTSHAFHSAMMDPILAEFTQVVKNTRRNAPKIAYISNVTGDWIKESEATDPTYWAQHLRQAVRFGDGVRLLLKDPLALLEVGPGDTLAKLSKAQLTPDGLQVVVSSVRHAQTSQDDHAFLLTALGQLWLEGVQIDWRGFYGKEKRHRVSLPTYPFERQRYWIDAAAWPFQPQSAPSITQKANLSNWFYTPGWKSAPRLPRPHLQQNESGWLLLLDDYGVGQTLAAQLRQAGQRVVTVSAGAGFEKTGAESFTIGIQQRGDYIRLLNEMGALPGRIIHLCSLVAESQGFEETQNKGFYSALFLAQALAGQTAQLWLVSNHAQKIEGADVLFPAQATLLGLSKVIGQEMPSLICRHLDISLPESGLLLAEIAAAPKDSAIAHRNGQRWLPTFEATPLNGASLPLCPLRPNGVYLITGGLSGIGFHIAKYLAQTVKARLILAEDGENEATKSAAVASLQALGAQIALIPATLTGATEDFGPINGAIHAMGLMGENVFELLQEISPVTCQQHFDRKVASLMALEKCFETQPDFCLLTSSLAAITGGIGYAAFAAADAALDAYAQAKGWVSVNWDGCDFQETGENPLALTPAEIGSVFQRILDENTGSRVIISTTDLQTRMEQRANDAAMVQNKGQREAMKARHPRPDDLPNPFATPRSEIESTIAQVWQGVLGIEPIGIDDNFFDLGGNSLIAVSAMSELKKTLKMSVPVAQLYQKPTIRNLSELLTQNQAITEKRVTALSERREQMARRNQTLHKRNQR